MPFKKIMRMMGMGGDKTGADMEKEEMERQRLEDEKRLKKKRRNIFKPHGREQMSDKEFEELEKASK